MSAGRWSPRRLWSRRVLVGVLIALGTIVAVVGFFNVWVKRQLLDTDAWVATSSELLANDNVRTAVSNRLVDTLFTNADVKAGLAEALPPAAARLAPALEGTLRELATRTADRFLELPRVQELWEDANRVAHTALLAVVEDDSAAISEQGGEVVLDLQPLLVELANEVGIPEQALSRLPPDAGQIPIMSTSEQEALQDAVRTIERLTVLFVLITLAFYAAALVLAKGRRRETFRAIGFCVIGVGILIAIIRRVAGQQLVDALAEGEIAERAASSTWLIATSLLVDLATGLVVLGALLVVSAWLLGPTRIATAIRRALAPTLIRHPGVAYGVVVLLYLLVILWSPTGERQLLGVIVLAALVFGLLELLRRKVRAEFPDGEPSALPPEAPDAPGPT